MHKLEHPLTLRVEETAPRFARPDETVRYIYCWLDSGNEPVAVVKLFRRDANSPNVIAAIEVRPDRRGRRLSGTLMRAVLDQVGPVWRTGTFSRSGWAASKHLPPIPYLPDCDKPADPATGQRPPRQPHVDDIDNFSFVCWKTGRFKE